MISNESRKQLEGLATTSYGIALIELINEHLEKISDIRTCTSLEEIEGRKHALKLIDDILGFMISKKVASSNRNRYN